MVVDGSVLMVLFWHFVGSGAYLSTYGFSALCHYWAPTAQGCLNRAEAPTSYQQSQILRALWDA